jgi:hypothetical protein
MMLTYRKHLSLTIILDMISIISINLTFISTAYFLECVNISEYIELIDHGLEL